MKAFYAIFLLIFLSLSCGNAADEINTDFELVFPVNPEISTEEINVKGQAMTLTTKMAVPEGDIFLLYELEFGDLTDEVKADQNGFFNGMLTYLMTDLGMEFGNLTEYKHNGFHGENFDILIPNKDESWTAKGKTLLIEDMGYIWFGMSKTQNSTKKVNDFVDSYQQD